jgi:hypothetical protein
MQRPSFDLCRCEQTAHRPYKTESPASGGVFFGYLSRMMCAFDFSFREYITLNISSTNGPLEMRTTPPPSEGGLMQMVLWVEVVRH